MKTTHRQQLLNQKLQNVHRLLQEGKAALTIKKRTRLLLKNLQAQQRRLEQQAEDSVEGDNFSS